MKICNRCKIEKNFSDLVKDVQAKDGFRYYCKSCKQEYDKNYYEANKEKAIIISRETGNRRRQFVASIKMTAGCQDCGYRQHPDALDFDHHPNEVKLFGLARLGSRSLSSIIREIMKCDVVCANCHRIRTASRRVEV